MREIVTVIKGNIRKGKGSFISILILIFLVTMSLTAVSVVSSKIFARERKDYGIYKALGFSSTNLKIQFATRFAIVALAGTILGCVMDILFGKQCIMLVLSSIGVSKMEAFPDNSF